MKLRIEHPSEADVLTLARTLREADVKELDALGQTDHRACILESLHLSEECWAAFDGHTLLCLFGVVRNGDIGIPWMLTSSHFQTRHMRDALGFATAILQAWLGLYPGGLLNVVHADNHKPKRWLRWMGFSVPAEPDYTAPTGARFHTFTLKRKCATQPEA